ncbi:MAG: nicotinate phosphoribosyltransferase [Pseudomonadota bacterium]
MTLSFFNHNLILNTDSYKSSHWEQYHPGTQAMFSYIESRGGAYPETVFFGLQAILKEYLSRPITLDNIEEAKEFFQTHGEPFNEQGWLHILNTYGGYLPLRIRAVPEGSVVSVKNVLMTVESLDPATFWLVSYLETLLLRVWYPTTVATISWHIRQSIQSYLDDTSDHPHDQIAFKLHDFGARGVSSTESSALGGLAHLVNFKGSDTVMALLAARRYYNEPMAGFSIPAAEHSTITSWGRNLETEAYANMLRLFAKPGALLAVVSDSYDLFNALEIWGTQLKQQIIDSGATLVIRPDSGNPTEIVLATLQKLESYFGCTVNQKGYKVLEHVRVIQGDGVNPVSIVAILDVMKANGFSADNVTFGMGGGLLQQLNRDTQAFAMKCSAVQINNAWVDVYKDPVTDPTKASKRGRLSLYRNLTTNKLETRRINEIKGYEDMMVTVWENGQLVKEWNFSEIRKRAEITI